MRIQRNRSIWLARLTPLAGLMLVNACFSNAAWTNFYTNVGTGVIDSAATAIGAPDAANAIAVQPLAGLLGDFWTGYVTTTIPSDPIYQNELLVP